jgi:hypothetical protein
VFRKALTSIQSPKQLLRKSFSVFRKALTSI